MIWLIRFLFGYVRFRILGKNQERFLNLCSKNGINLFNIKKKKGIIYANVLVSEYKYLRKFAGKCQIRLKIYQKQGLRFKIRKYKNRPGIFVGCILFCFIIYFFSMYIWSIDVEGNSDVAKEEILNMVSRFGVTQGTLKSGISPEEIENLVMEKFDNISWSSVHMQGSSLKIEVKEKAEIPQIIPENEPANIKAKIEGQITRLEIYSGKPEILIGDAVTKGQLLVNGVVEDKYGGSLIKRARAKVFANTKHNICEKIDRIYYENVPTGREENRERIKIFGVELPTVLKPSPLGIFKKEVQIKEVQLLGSTLPIKQYCEKFIEVVKKRVELTPEQAELKMKEIIKTKIETDFKDIKILKTEEQERLTDSEYILDITFYCEEDIGILEPIDIY